MFKDVSSVQTALNMNGIEYEGHHLRVDRREASNMPSKRSIFCGNIPFDTTDDEMWQFFEEAGEIDYVRVVRDNATGEQNTDDTLSFHSEHLASCGYSIPLPLILS